MAAGRCRAEGARPRAFGRLLRMVRIQLARPPCKLGHPRSWTEAAASAEGCRRAARAPSPYRGPVSLRDPAAVRKRAGWVLAAFARGKAPTDWDLGPLREPGPVLRRP